MGLFKSGKEYCRKDMADAVIGFATDLKPESKKKQTRPEKMLRSDVRPQAAYIASRYNSNVEASIEFQQVTGVKATTFLDHLKVKDGYCSQRVGEAILACASNCRKNKMPKVERRRGRPRRKSSDGKESTKGYNGFDKDIVYGGDNGADYNGPSVDAILDEEEGITPSRDSIPPSLFQSEEPDVIPETIQKGIPEGFKPMSKDELLERLIRDRKYKSNKAGVVDIKDGYTTKLDVGTTVSYGDSIYTVCSVYDHKATLFSDSEEFTVYGKVTAKEVNKTLRDLPSTLLGISMQEAEGILTHMFSKSIVKSIRDNSRKKIPGEIIEICENMHSPIRFEEEADCHYPINTLVMHGGKYGVVTQSERSEFTLLQANGKEKVLHNGFSPLDPKLYIFKRKKD